MTKINCEMIQCKYNKKTKGIYNEGVCRKTVIKIGRTGSGNGACYNMS